ncbi:PD-(D/E)XK nuclease family protein [Nitriliruptoraceae bacterium ZYF776]|nr:PD-(D/E)XK nuclease family protein [Profundirhabdus halotolerans]
MSAPLPSAAHARLRAELFGWNRPRPPADPAGVAALREELEAALAALGPRLELAATSTGRQQLLVTKTRLDRLACDGWALDPAPYEHTVANVRGTLAHKALERDLDARAAEPAAVVVAAAWRELAARSPGDPASVSRWLNACPAGEADDLRADVTTLLLGFREVWPELPPASVRVRTEPRLDVTLAGGRVRLQGTPDLVISSRHRDDRARTLLVDFKTGIPRSEHDRHELRFYALLAALDAGRFPFRWATFYVTEGRPEHEDLRVETLRATLRRVVDAVEQAARLTEIRDGRAAARLRGGLWCRNCLRRDGCDEGERAARAALADGVFG